MEMNQFKKIEIASINKLNIAALIAIQVNEDIDASVIQFINISGGSS
jgi:hypothetical protein